MIRYIFVFLLSVSALLSQSQVIVKKSGDVFTDFSIDMYEDSSSSLSFEEIKNKKFTPHSNSIAKGYSDSYFWIRFKIKNETDLDIKYIVKAAENTAHELDCYVLSANGTYVKYEKGIGYFSENQVNKLKKSEFRVDLSSGEVKTVYLRAHWISSAFGAFYVFDDKSLNDYKLKHDIIYSLFFGAIFALILYNLFIYLFSRETAYLYYVLYTSSFLAWQLMFNGFSPLNTFNSTASYYATSMFIPFLLAFLLFFTRTLLDTKSYLFKLDYAIKYSGYTYIILSFGTLYFFHESFVIINALATIVFPFLLYIGFKSYQKGNKTAIFFITAQIVFLLTSTMFSLMTDSYIEYTLVSRHSLVVGSLIELILFALALAYRIRLLQIDKYQIINKAKRELEEKVYERTQELNELTQNLELRVQKELEKNRLKDQQMIQQTKQAQMGELLSMIAHQWRQPLGAISAASTNLHMKLFLETFDLNSKAGVDEARKYFIEKLDDIDSYVQNLTTTINDFRDFYKPNKRSVKSTLEDVVTKSLKIINGSLISDRIEIIKEYNSDEEVDLYNNEIMQVLLNIIQNAQDNIKEKDIKNPYIKIIIQSRIITICDNGGGIPEDIIDNVFDPYFSTKEEKNGTGLGLYMSKMIVEEHHNAKLHVKNTDDGACFILEFL